jgi:hypothetical protein
MLDADERKRIREALERNKLLGNEEVPPKKEALSKTEREMAEAFQNTYDAAIQGDADLQISMGARLRELMNGVFTTFSGRKK